MAVIVALLEPENYMYVLVVHYLTTFCQSQASKNAGYMTCVPWLGQILFLCVVIFNDPQ